MSTPDEERLLALLAGIRRRSGDGVLSDPGRLTVMLSDEAPELRPLIRGLAAALAAGAGERLRASPDPGGEAVRLTAEIAAAHGIDAHAARAGVDLAARVGGVAAPAAPAAQAAQPRTEWVGASTPIPGQAAPAAPTGAAPAAGMADFAAKLKNKWVLGGAAALVALYLFNNQRPSPTPIAAPVAPAAPAQPTPAQPAPAQPTPAQPAPAAPAQPAPAAGNNGGLPMLSTDRATAGRTMIPVQQSQQGSVMHFGVPGASGTVHGIVLVSTQGWSQAIVAFGSLGASEPETVSTAAPFNLQQGQGIISRVMLPQWQRDGIGAGGICVVFWQREGTDVQLHGSNLCLLSASDNDCKQIIGCATIQ